jgi:DNA-binding transcriptional LysR family regulator
LPAGSSVTRGFHKELRRRGIRWPQSVEVSSIEEVTSQVAAGAGIGVSLAITEAIADPGVRALPLEGFAPIDTGLRWTGGLTPLLRDTILELQRYTRETWPDWAIDDVLLEPKKAGRRKA